MKKLLSLFTLLLLIGGGKTWADTAAFTFNSSSSATTVDGVSITGGSTSTNGYNASGAITISSSGNTITQISLTYSDDSKDRNGGTVTVNTGSYSYDSGTKTGTWTGSASSVALTPASGAKFRITSMTVTYSSGATGFYSISVKDLYLEHQTYNPTRENIAGFNLTFSGWQSFTNTGTTPYSYSLLLSNASKSDNAITIETNSSNSDVKITQVVLVYTGTDFTNSTPSSSNTYKGSENDQIIWQNATGASSATLSITATDQPYIGEIWIFTDRETTWSKQDVTISYPTKSSAVSTGSSEVKIAYPTTTPANFRLDYTYSAGTTDATGTQHIGGLNYGITPGSTAGTATVTATAPASTYFNANSTGDTYSLIINDGSTKSTTITVDDMRISKTANTDGLTASDGFDRTLGGFSFAFSGGQGVKYNNGDGIIIRYSDASNIGTLTISPQKNNSEASVKIMRVDITTYPTTDYTNGTFTVSGLEGTQSISGVSSHSFAYLNSGSGVDKFTITAASGTLYIQSFTIYYVDATGTLNTTNAPVTITFTPAGPYNGTADSFTSPTISTSPANFDISLATSNADVATVKTSNWLTAPLISLQGLTETEATITASAAESTFFDAANATYIINVTEASSTSKKWDFTTLDVTNTITNDKGWNSGMGWASNGTEYYENQFTTSDNYSKTGNWSTYRASSGSQFEELLFARNDNGGLKVGNMRLYSTYLTYNNTKVVIGVPVQAGQSVIVTFDGGSGTNEGFEFSNATLEGDPTATSIRSNSTQKTVTLTALADGYVTLVNTAKPRLYKIEVKNETRATLTLTDGVGSNTYERNVGTGTTSSTDNHFNHRVIFTPSDGAANALTYANDAGNLSVASSDPSVLDVSNAYIASGSFGQSSAFYIGNVIPKSAGTATLTITFAGNNNYKPTSYTSQVYTVYGPGTFKVQADDQEIQRGQLSEIIPSITDEDGNPIGIKEMSDNSGRYTTYILKDEEDTPDYTTYFDFTYTATETGNGTNWEKITVNSTSGQISTEEGDVAAEPGATRKITITATPKEDYRSAFTSASGVSTNMTVTIIEKVADVQLEFFWDAACTLPVDASEHTDANPWVFNQGKFSSGFPNGRMIYAKVKNEGDSIWFSYAQNATAAVIPANPKIDKKNRVFEYLRGVPIYIDETVASGDYVFVNIVATTWDGSTKKRKLNGSVQRMKFPIKEVSKRPAKPTYEPISPDEDSSKNKNGKKIMNTSQNVVAFGEGATSSSPTGDGNLVYGKFSTSSIYTTEQLINEKTVTYRIDNVPVISTEVADRRFTAVQIKTIPAASDATYGYGEYISLQTYTEYYYLYDTNTQLTPTEYNINVSSSTSSAPTVKVTWYNKRNYDNPKSNNGVTQEVDTYTGKISYAITGYYDADAGSYGTDAASAPATVDASTGIVTSGTKQGWVKVTATYAGGEQHGGKSGEPQYVSTTDVSTADFYVYIYDETKQRPVITPTTRNFTGKLTYKITAPTDWDVIYTADGSTPTVPESGAPNISHGSSLSKVIGKSGETGVEITMAVGTTHTVKAIAYNPSDRSQYSAVVSESYTLKDPLPDPVFDPSGVGTPYSYNTDELIVQISCPYAGSEIYYTITETSPDAVYPDPELRTSYTYKYSGLSKVTVMGNMTIKAIAYDPVQQIFSNVVTSVYQYSDEMYMPYFQILDDGKWYGYDASNNWVENGTKWQSASQEKDITPTTQIRIVDPNPIQGTIYYTIDGSTPDDNATSTKYVEGYPFTVPKTVTGKAITILQNARSEVAAATFNINAETYNVWEAVNETTPAVGDVHGMRKADGFVISTEVNLAVKNTATTVNKNSITSAGSKGGNASKMYAQEHITATFGGYDLEDWTEMTIADAAIGTPLDKVGDYSIKSTNNAQDEEKKNYNHKNSYEPTTTYGKTFKLPARGTYVRFEPERDGDLTIWILQQGALNYENDKYLVDNYIRLRPVYLVDEQGKSYKVKEVNGVPQLWSAARLSENWSKMVASDRNNNWADYTNHTDHIGVIQYIRKSDGAVLQTKPDDYDYADGEADKDGTIDQEARDEGKYLKIVNKGPNAEESKAIYSLFDADLTKNHVNIGDPIKPFAIHTGATISLNDGTNIDTSNDGTGYVLATGGYAKYTFEVKAGKTYFFFGQGTKIGVRGFQFVSTDDGSYETVSINEESGNSSDAYVKDKTVNVTLNRTFSNKWTTLVLPFSVSTKQIEEKFGPQTDIIHFDQINGDRLSNIHMKRHWHKMIVAGTPVLIKPTNESTENPTFNGVQIELGNTEAGTIEDPNAQFDMLSTFTYQEKGSEKALKKNDYYINKTTGNFQKFIGEQAAMKGTMAWLRPRDGVAAAKTLSVSFASFFDDEENTATGSDLCVEDSDGIRDALFPTNGNIYNLNGQMVSTGSLEGLRKGVYIVNGKKVVVE